MSDALTWYDLLDVPRDATAGEVRAAWKGQIAGLEPGDRRFYALSCAAKVLLDPVSRAAYDAGLGATPLVEEDALAPVARPADEPVLVTRLRRSSTSDGNGEGVPSWVLAGLGVVVAALLAITAWMWLREDAGSDDADREAATPEMTGRSSTDYDNLFASGSTTLAARPA